MLRVPEWLEDEILDGGHTVSTETGVMKAVLDRRKTVGRHVMRYPDVRVHDIIVSSELRVEILAAGLTLCTFSPVPSTHRDVR